MTTNNDLVKDEDKSFDGDCVICEQCEWNGVPDQKIVMDYLGIRPVDEFGFIYIYEIYDYSGSGAKKIHRHRFDPELIDQQVNSIFGQKVIFVH